MPTVISVGAIAADAILRTQGFMGNADKILEKGIQVRHSMQGLAQSIASVGQSFTIMAIGGNIAAQQLASNILKTGDAAEKTGIMMGVLSGETAKSGDLFLEMAEYAATVPFEIQEVANSFMMLTGAMGGSTAAAKTWMPVMSDMAALATTMGITYQEASSQFLRMITMGTGAVDLFRDRGLLSMMGLNSEGKSMEEFREEVYKTLTDPKYKDAANKLQNSLSGIFSAIRDQFALLKIESLFGEGELFEDIKNGMRKVLNVMETARKPIAEWINENKRMVEVAILATGAFLGLASAMVVLGYVIPPINLSLKFMGTILSTGVNVAVAALTGNIQKLFALLSPVALGTAGWLLLGLAVGGVVYAMRALVNQSAAMIPVIAAAKAGWRAFADDVNMAVKTIALNLETLFLELPKSIAQMIKLAKDAMNAVMVFPGAPQFDTSGAEAVIEYAEAVSEGMMEGPLSKGIKTSYDMVKSFGEVVTDAYNTAKPLVDLLYVETKDSVFKQLFVDGDMLMDKVKSYAPILDDFFAASGERIAANRFGDLTPDFSLGGDGFRKEKGPKTSEAEKEFERLKAAGEALFLTLSPVDGMLNELVESLAELGAANKVTEDTINALRKSLFETFGDDLTVEQLRKVEEAALALSDVTGMTAAGLADMKQNMTFAEELESAKAVYDSYVTFDDMIQSVRDSIASMNLYMTENAEDWSSGKADIFASKILEQASANSVEAIDEFLKAIGDLPPAVQKAIAKIRGELYKMDAEEEFDRMLGSVEQLGGAISGLGGSFKLLGNIVQSAATIYRAAMAAMSGGTSELLVLIAEVIAAIGLFGSEGEKATSDMEKFMEDLGQAVEGIVDRMTDAIIEFARTGKAEVGDLVDYILTEFLRAGVSNLIVSPAIDFIGDAIGFADGGVFDGGDIVSSPTYFGTNKGLGVMGEAGTEGVFPLTRINGELGVKALTPQSGTTVVVNVHGAPKEDVSVSSRQSSDGSTIIDVVYNVVKRGLISGEFDNALRTSKMRS